MVEQSSPGSALLSRLEERIAGYDSLLGEPQWKPSRSHIEATRNLLRDAADALRGVAQCSQEPVCWIVLAKETDNVRIWWRRKEMAEEWAKTHDAPLIPLYAHPRCADAVLPLSAVPPSPVAGEWQPIETAPRSIQRFAEDCANDEGRGGYIEFGGTVVDGRPFVICRNNDGWRRFDRWLILPSVEGASVSSTKREST